MLEPFSEQELKNIELVKAKYPEPQSALMPVLWLAQHKYGWISDEVKQYVADMLNVSYAQVHGVAHFYTMYFKKPMGKKHIQVCTNVSCMIKGAEEIYQFISDKLAIGNNEVTPDGNFSLEEVECMGACGYAPMIAVNEEFIENVDINKIDSLMENFK